MVYNKYKDEDNLYILNYPKNEEELCFLECRVLFDKNPRGKYLFSNYYFSASDSPFIKSALRIKYSSNTLEGIVEKIKNEKTAYEDFKVIYLRLEDCDISYEERLIAVKKIGMDIVGRANIKNPKIILGITKVGDIWLLGEFDKNNCLWHIHDKKPKSYSNSIGFRIAKSLVNLAIGRERELRVIDPCCGVGTVILEGLWMGIDIVGCEIKPQIAANARRNLEFFNYKDVITLGNMKELNKKYDAEIIDLPYGVFTPITKEEQEDIIKAARKLAKRLVIITFENMDQIIEEAGFNILDKASIAKGNFIRHISICE